GVDAVAQSSGIRAVREDVAQVAAAGCAENLGPPHSVRGVDARLDAVEGRWLEEARPTGSGVELRLRAEELGAAPGTAVDAGVFGIDIRACERALGAGLTEHVILLRSQTLAPFGVGDGGFAHGSSVANSILT